ncbi:MAG: hypothetical protein RJA63_3554, partial [Pseudomonadota bacterium]
MTRQTAPNLLNTAHEVLLQPYALTTEALDRALSHILAHDVDYADLYFQYQRAESWSLEEGIVKAGSFNIEQGVGVRAVAGEKTAFAYSDDINERSLLEAAATVRSIARQGQAGSVALAPRGQPAPLYAAADPIPSLADADKVALLEKLEQLARREDPRVIQAMAFLASTWDVVMVARSDGVMAADVRPLVRLSLTVIMEDGGRRE